MHLRSGDGEAKLVRCSFGEVFDVVVDLRPESPTFRNREIFRSPATPRRAFTSGRLRARFPGAVRYR